jgi:phosphoribosylaminoimidazolecarboxamide formyltransferase/IMP cyclohydrolase
VADLTLAMVTARYTQSNSITYAKAGMVVGIGAGQQSRVDCTKLAGAKVDTWWLRRHDKVRSLAFKSDMRRQDRINWQIHYIEGDMTSAERDRFLDAVHVAPAPLTADDRASWLAGLEEVALASDGYISFRDNIDHAARHGVRYLAHPGGSTRSDEVRTAAAEHGITIVDTGVRLFHH